MLSFKEKLKLTKSKLVMTYQAKTSEGKDFFAYVLCKEDKVRQMKLDYESRQPASAASYGEVLYSDFISAADEKATDFLNKWLKEKGGEAF